MVKVVAVLPVCLAMAMQAGAQGPRETISFDRDWKFQQAEAVGASEAAFADAGWSKVDVPHDWAIAGPFAAENPSGGAGAFAPAGVGWYRKHFTLPAADAGKRVFVDFDGVMANSDVWINGFLLGHRPNGYVSFRYELTGHLAGGKGDNVLAVRADNAKQPSSRFYEGAGIYRHVRLLVMDPVHLAQWGTFISTPEVSAASSSVAVETEVTNQGTSAVKAALRVTILDPSGHPVGSSTLPADTIAAGKQESFKLAVPVSRPDRWDTDHPAMYSARVEVLAGAKVLDSEVVPFGIREFHFDPDKGFLLNGRSLKLLGVALHSDVGSLGMAAPLGAWEHRLAAMKALGANAIRTAHNPVAPEFLDLCDRMGLLVMDEMFDQWTVAKNPYDYHLYFREWNLRDTHDVVRRDRNHPSVILWSAGNEIHDTPNAPLANEILTKLVAQFHADDPTRPVTQALFRPNVSHDYDNGLADLLDVVGQNYRPAEILAAHAQKPTRKIIGTENTHGRDQWLPVRDNAAYSGMFIWSGVDYLGEARRWPVIGSGGGMDDRTDAMKPDALEHESWWKTGPVVHLVRRVAPTPLAPTDPGYGGATGGEEFRPQRTVFADWTPPSSAVHDERVEVYSNCPQVELALNGKSLGTKAINADASPRTWTVAFAPGAITASCGRGASETLHTAGKAARLKLTVERARLSSSFDDVAYVRATVVDEAGTVVPEAAVPLAFAVSGPAVILATDNGDNSDHSGFGKTDRNAFHGAAIAIVRATARAGSVTINVSSPGLTGAAATLPISAETVR